MFGVLAAHPPAPALHDASVVPAGGSDHVVFQQIATNPADQVQAVVLRAPVRISAIFMEVSRTRKTA